MAFARPLISTFSADKCEQILQGKENKIPLPVVFCSPIRQDIVQFVHSNLNKNRRQAQGVDPKAGMKHSAESWGTGRAVARIPRVGGSGTHRSGQAAFGNMCRKGRMFAPLKIWRRWHRKVNLNQRRHALTSAIAATGLAPLVMAHGHKIDKIRELPLVIENKIENFQKTKDAVSFLKRINAYEDVKRVIKAKQPRAGKGKMRNRRYKERVGPLIVYANENVQLVRAFRNIPGVEVQNVYRLGLKQLAPGGNVGRFVIWTQDSFKALDRIFGSYRKKGEQKNNYQLQRSCLSNADLSRIINSNEIQSVVNPAKKSKTQHYKQKKNPLKNKKAMARLNPYFEQLKVKRRQQQQENIEKKMRLKTQKKGISKSQTKEKKKIPKNKNLYNF